MTNRKMQALRNLAERPGTEAEGRLARELLARFEGHEDPPDTIWKIWDDFEAGGFAARAEVIRATKDEIMDLLAATIRAARNAPLPTHWECACGTRIAVGQKCGNAVKHAIIQEQIRGRFSLGDRVFYNYWAYTLNSPAIVHGYVRPKQENGSHPWAWITLKFDHLKSNRQVPIHSAKGWHLTHEPLPIDEAQRLARP